MHSIEEFDPTTGKRTALEVWRDRSKGGGVALLSDPKASQINSEFVNQTNLGGSSTLNVGKIESKVSTNGIEKVGGAVKDTGGAVGKILNPASSLLDNE